MSSRETLAMEQVISLVKTLKGISEMDQQIALILNKTFNKPEKINMCSTKH